MVQLNSMDISFYLGTTLYLKKLHCFRCYNFEVHQPILVTFRQIGC